MKPIPPITPTITRKAYSLFYLIILGFALSVSLPVAFGDSKMASVAKQDTFVTSPLIYDVYKHGSPDLLGGPLWRKNRPNSRHADAYRYLDLDGKGRKRWEWVGPKSGLLVYFETPPKQSTLIDGTHLFGTSSFGKKWANGYEALASLDKNSDGKVSGAELEGVYLWFDKSPNGYVESSEYVPASTVFEYLPTKYESDSEGNVWQKGAVPLRDGTKVSSWDWWPRGVGSLRQFDKGNVDRSSVNVGSSSGLALYVIRYGEKGYGVLRFLWVRGELYTVLALDGVDPGEAGTVGMEYSRVDVVGSQLSWQMGRDGIGSDGDVKVTAFFDGGNPKSFEWIEEYKEPDGGLGVREATVELVTDSILTTDLGVLASLVASVSDVSIGQAIVMGRPNGRLELSVEGFSAGGGIAYLNSFLEAPVPLSLAPKKPLIGDLELGVTIE